MLDSFFALVGAALALDRTAIAAAGAAPHAWEAALLVAFLAGLSLTLGQSVVLFANRVSPRRFVVLLVASALAYVLGLLLWGGTIWLLVTFVLRQPLAPLALEVALCAGQAPILLGVLILLPYVGSGLQRLLSAWSLVVVVVALSALAGARLADMALVVGAGWALRELAGTVLNRPLAGVKLLLWQAASGRDVLVDPAALLPRLAARERREGQEARRSSTS